MFFEHLIVMRKAECMIGDRGYIKTSAIKNDFSEVVYSRLGNELVVLGWLSVHILNQNFQMI